MSSKLVEEADSDDDEADDGGTDSCQRRDLLSALTCESELESCSCPLCHCSYANSNSLWQHINLEHVSRSRFPSVSFLSAHKRRLCSECGFAYSAHWKVCRRSQGPGRPRCGGLMVDPLLSSWLSRMASTHDLASAPTDVTSRHSVTGESASGASSGSSSCPFTDQISHFEDPVLEAIEAACSLACPVHLEAVLFESLMQEVSLLQVKTTGHIPRSVRPVLAEVLATEFRNATYYGLWGYARLHVLPKAVLRCPPRGGRKKYVVVKSLLLSRLERWTSGDIQSLWFEARLDADCKQSSNCKSLPVDHINRKWALAYAREGRYRDAMLCLGCLGTSSPHDSKVLEEIY